MTLASFSHIVTKERLTGTRWLGVGVLAAIHLAAIGVAAWTEYDWVGPAIFMLAWALLNFTFIALLRRPAISAGLSLCLFVAVIGQTTMSSSAPSPSISAARISCGDTHS